MSGIIELKAEHNCSVAAILVEPGRVMDAGSSLIIVEAMKMQSSLSYPKPIQIQQVFVEPGQQVIKGQTLMTLQFSQQKKTESSQEHDVDDSNNQQLLSEVLSRKALTLDKNRLSALEKRHKKGFKSARENLALLCDPDNFQEYGQFAVAAQRQRVDYEELKSTTAADGIITGIGQVNADSPGQTETHTALIINDYSVLAGTQGFFHHQKLDRMLAIAAQRKLPVIMYTEGGGGRPGDTDITIVNSGLQCLSFSSWAALSGVVPRIAVNNGYCFAGNAALFGAADITIATQKSNIGMAGPAMIEGGGLGKFKPTEIGPVSELQKNGVVDIVVQDEVEAAAVAKHCLGFFQGVKKDWLAPKEPDLVKVLPEDRRFAYNVRDVISAVADLGSFVELKSGFGGAIVTGLMRLEGRSVGVLASDCRVLGGAIDIDAAEKAADFITLCDEFSIPLVSLCDTPGFMVGPEHENRGAARRLTRMFKQGAKVNVPFIAVVLRKCYGLGAQALLGGSTQKPDYMLSWPTGEFGAMGLEGAVALGFKKELDAQSDPKARQKLFDKLLAKQYERGQAMEVASVLEIDAVIDPNETRQHLVTALRQFC